MGISISDYPKEKWGSPILHLHENGKQCHKEGTLSDSYN